MRDHPVALVTGAARGIGLAIAQSLIAAGYRVMAADLGGDQAWNYQLGQSGDIAQALRATDATSDNAPQYDICNVDVTDAAACEQAVQCTIETFGQLNLLVNNAGIVDSGPITEFSEDAWDQIFAVNTKGIFLMSKAAIPHLRVSENASIVNTASIAGKRGMPNMAAYCGSKFAAIGITQSMALELAADKIRVNAICPGIVGTAMWLDHLIPRYNAASDAVVDFDTQAAQLIPMGEPQTAEDMADAVLYLASARAVTGIALTVAGGMEMN
jgi:meso-butanediol dehydrogenase/(S,S)-butanediol dehydrogenase/diacetyl reductase